MSRFLRASCLAFALAAAPHAPAAPPPPPGEGAVPSDEPRIESFPVKGSRIERVRATVAVRAPIDGVRSTVFDFPRYPQFVPRYKKASILAGTLATGLAVRMDLEELGGLVHFWMRVDISPPARTGAVESYDGHLVEGNVRAFFARWELEPMERGATRLVLESYFDPGIGIATPSMVNDGAREGLRGTIRALKARAEGRAVVAGE